MDLILAAQLLDLAAQRSNLLALLVVLSSSPRLPLSASACLTCLRNVSRSVPKSAATWAIGRSLSSARRTPRSINSSGYSLVRDMPEGSLSRGRIHGTEPPSKPAWLMCRWSRQTEQTREAEFLCSLAQPVIRWRFRSGDDRGQYVLMAEDVLLA